MRLQTLAATAAAVLVIAGCGGGDSDSNQALSYDAFGTALNETCQTFDEATESLSDLSGDPEQDVDLLEEGAAAAEEQLESTRDLEPPAELQEDYDTYLSQIETATEGLADAQGAAEDGDTAEYQRILEALNETVEAEGSEAANNLGAGDCF